MVELLVRVQPSVLVPTTVYVVSELGEAFTEEPMESFNVLFGVHLYVAAPQAVMAMESPKHIESKIGVIPNSGVLRTFT